MVDFTKAEREQNVDSRGTKTYTLEDIEKYLDVQKRYLDEHGLDTGFEMVHTKGIDDLKGFVSGEIEIEPDAYDKMVEFINTFAGGYTNEEMKKLHSDAMAKLEQLKSKKQNNNGLTNEGDATPEPAQVHDGDTNGRSDDVSATRKSRNKHEVHSWFDEEKEDKHYIYEIKESNRAQNGSLGRKTRHSFVERDGKSEVFFVNATSRFEYDNKHTQELKAKDIEAKLDGSEFEGTILFGNERNPQELKVKVKKENNVLVVVINGNQESFAADVFEKDGQQSSLHAFLRSQGFNDHDDYTSIAGSIVATYHDVQNISAILRSNESAVKNIANRPEITDIQQEIIPIPDVIEVENKYRERNPDNFDNEIELAKIELNVLLTIGHITEEDYRKAFAIYERINLVKSNAKVDPTTETEFVSSEDIDFAKSVLDSGRDKVNQKDIAAYRQQIVGQILTSSDEIKQTLLTPELTAIAIEAIEAQQGNKELSEEEKEKLEASKKSLLEHGKGLLENIEKLEGYYYTDITNAADEYDGYMHLCSAYEKAENTEESSDLCSKVREKMDEYIKPYDEYYKIPNKENPRSTAIKLNDRIKKASELADSIQFNEETLGKELLETLGKYKFIKEYKDGEPVYEESLHTNSDGKLEVVPGSRLETVLKFSLNHSMMRQLGDFDRDITEESLVEETKENAFVTLFSFDNAEQTVLSGLREHPTKFTDPQYLTEFRQKLSQGQPMSISPIGFDLAIKRQAHNVETYSNRLSSQLGREHTQFLNSALLARVKKIDATSPYKDNVKFIMDKSTKRNLWGAGIGFGFAALSGYVFTKCTANSAMSAALKAAKQGISPGFASEIGIGGGSALVGAIAGAAITTATYFATKKVISLFKKQKYGWQDVKKEFRDPAFWGIVGAGALSGASVGFALSGCPSCATACGMGALASAGFARFIKPYRDMRLYGHNKKTATAMGLLNAVSVFAGGYIGRAAAMNGIEAQTDTVVADKETFDALKNGDSDKLAEGWVYEDARAGDEGAYIWDTKNIRTYDASSVASAKDRVSQWVEPEMLDKLHQDALSKGLSEETFWRYMNNSILANKDGVPAEFGTNRAYDMTVQTGTDFETILPAQIKHSDNHFMYYKENMESLGITPEEREIMAGFIDWKSGTINADENTLSTMYKAENWLTEDGAINTSTKDLIHNNSGIKNAQYDLSSKELVAADPNSGAPKTFTSVHKGNTGFTDKIVDIFARFTKEVRTEPFAAFGVLLVDTVNTIKSYIRPGAKADKIISEVMTKSETTPQEPITPKPEQKPEPKPEPRSEPKPEPTTPEHEQPENNDVEEQIKALLDKEYKIVHGLVPKEKERERYRNLVQAEMQKNSLGTDSELAYMQERMKRFNKTLQTQCAPLDNAEGFCDTKEGKKRINRTRQLMWQTNLASDGEVLESKNVTLLHFRELVGEVHNEGKSQNAAAARDSRRAPASKDKGDRPNGGVLEVQPQRTTPKKPNPFKTGGGR